MDYAETLARLKALSRESQKVTDKTDRSPETVEKTGRGVTDKTDRSPFVSNVSAVRGNPEKHADPVEGRRKAGDRMAAWVAGRVRAVAPPGLGRWAPAWDLVEAPSRAFLDALNAWETSGAPEDHATTQEAAAAVVAAWREAARLWREEEQEGEPPSTHGAECDQCGKALGATATRCASCRYGGGSGP